MKVCASQALVSTIRCCWSSQTTGMSRTMRTRLCARRLGSAKRLNVEIDQNCSQQLLKLKLLLHHLLNTEVCSVCFNKTIQSLCHLGCKACAPGTHSKKITDIKGDTHICVPCAAGTSQASGASLSCKECKAGAFGIPPVT